MALKQGLLTYAVPELGANAITFLVAAGASWLRLETWGTILAFCGDNVPYYTIITVREWRNHKRFL